MHIEVWGEHAERAERVVVFVHGAMTDGPSAWAKQRPLADRWRLAVATRRGFVPNPPVDVCDFAIDADDIREVIGRLGPVHLVGHSYGGLIALLVAAKDPALVRSLTLIEPAVMSLVRGHPLVEAAIASHLELLRDCGDDPRAFLSGFTRSLGGDAKAVPDPFPDPLRQHVELLIHERFPWEAEIDVAPIVEAHTPTLVVSGGHDPMLGTLADAAAYAIAISAQRVVITGRGHAVQRVGDPFNEALEQFLIANS